jgi:hypothetical protein
LYLPLANKLSDAEKVEVCAPTFKIPNNNTTKIFFFIALI